jgi:hypothetical protein
MGGLGREPGKFFFREATAVPDVERDGSGGNGSGQLRLVSGEEFLWRPMLAGLVHYRDIIENRVDLCDIAVMNELLDVRDYNSYQLAETQQRGR